MFVKMYNTWIDNVHSIVYSSAMNSDRWIQLAHSNSLSKKNEARGIAKAGILFSF